MSRKNDIKSFLEKKADEGNSQLISSVMGLLGFTARLPFYALQALLFSLLVSGLLAWSLAYFQTSVRAVLIATVFGILFFVLFSLSTAFSIICKALLNRLQDISQEILNPVDELYDQFQSKSGQKIARSEYLQIAWKEVILPRALDQIPNFPLLPFRSFLQKQFLKPDNELKKVKGGARSEEAGPIDQVQSRIESIFQNLKKAAGRPWRISFRLALIAWLFLILLRFII